MLIILPIPPSKNRKFFVSNGRIVLTKEVKDFYEYCEDYSLEHYREVAELCSLWDKDMLRIEVEYYIKTMRRDTSNLIPVLFDGLKRLLGIDDKYYLLTELKKVKDINEKLKIFISFDNNDEKNKQLLEKLEKINKNA